MYSTEMVKQVCPRLSDPPLDAGASSRNLLLIISSMTVLGDPL